MATKKSDAPRCATCKHAEFDDGDDEAWCHRIMNDNAMERLVEDKLGRCSWHGSKSDQDIFNNELRKLESEELVIAKEDSGGVMIWVKRDFGCVLHEERGA